MMIYVSQWPLRLYIRGFHLLDWAIEHGKRSTLPFTTLDVAQLHWRAASRYVGGELQYLQVAEPYTMYSFKIGPQRTNRKADTIPIKVGGS